METQKIVRMADYSGNTLQLSREQALEDFRNYLEHNPDVDKVFLLALDTKDGFFRPFWLKAQMLNSQALAALDLVHAELIEDLEGR